MLSRFKGKFNKIFSLLVMPLDFLRVKPNHITFLSLLLAFVFFYFVVDENFFSAFVLILIISLLDAMDGALARRAKKQTIYGAYLDTIVDRYVEFIIFFSFLFINLPEIFLPAYFWIIFAIFGSLITTYAKAACYEKINYMLEGGLFERGERMLFLIFIVFVGGYSYVYLTYLLIIFSVLTNLSALDRIRTSLKLCTRK